MNGQRQMVYVRRGVLVKGPIPLAQVASLFKAGKLLPSDELAASSTGPWDSVPSVLGKTRPSLPVVETYAIKKSLLFGDWIAVFQCPKCGEPLECAEKDMTKSDACPTCRQRYQLSPQAAEEVTQAKKAHEQERAAAVASKRAQREHVAGAAQETAAAVSQAAARGLVASAVVAKILLMMTVGFVVLVGVVAAAEYAIRWYRDNTPTARFHRFASDVLREVDKTFPLRPVRHVNLDLRKTDSLTAPYAGTIAFETVRQMKMDRRFTNDQVVGECVLEGNAACEISCAEEVNQFDGRKTWLVKNATMKTTKWRVVSAEQGSAAVNIVNGLNREGTAPDIANSRDEFLALMSRTGVTFGPDFLTELSEGVAHTLGASNEVSLNFEKIEGVEPSAMKELVDARRQVVEYSYSQSKKGEWSKGMWPLANLYYGSLKLDGLSTISGELARTIAPFRGWVSLRGVQSLSEEAAEHLATHYGTLDLGGLERLSPSAAVALSRHPDDLILGVTALPDEAWVLLATDPTPQERTSPAERKHVELLGLKEISAAGITAVTSSPVRFSMPRLKTLTSVPLAKKLIADTDEENVTGESLDLSGVESLSDEVADVVAEFQGNIRLSSLQKLTSVRLAKRLVADAGGGEFGLLLHKTKILSVAAAGVLAEFSGPISIGSTDEEFNLTPDVAAALARHLGELDIDVHSLTSEAAAALAGHEGRLEIHSQEEVSRAVLDLLTTHKGKVEVTQQEPTFKKYQGGDGTPVVADRE